MQVRYIANMVILNVKQEFKGEDSYVIFFEEISDVVLFV